MAGQHDVIQFCVVALVMLLAAIGNFEGGFIFVPMLIAIFDLNVKNAIHLSNIAIVGGALVKFWSNLSKTHPNCDRPLIDTNFVLVVVPWSIGGALLGTYINKFTPDWILSMLLTTLILLTGLLSLKRGLFIYRSTLKNSVQSVSETTMLLASQYYKVPFFMEYNNTLHCENQHKFHIDQSKQPPDYKFYIDQSTQPQDYKFQKDQCKQPQNYNTMSIVSDKNTNHISEEIGCPNTKQNLFTRPSQCNKVQIGIEPQLLESKWKDLIELERRTSFKSLANLGILMILVILLTVLKGGQNFNSPLALDYPSIGYWVLIFVPFPLLVVYSFKQGKTFQHSQEQKLGYEMIEGELLWTRRRMCIIPLLFLVAGLISGTFGLGGGLLYSSLLLELRFHPAVVAATTSTMVLYSCCVSSISLSVLEFAPIPSHDAFLIFLLAMTTTKLRQMMFFPMVKRFTAWIVLLVAAVYLVSAGAMCLVSMESIQSEIPYNSTRDLIQKSFSFG